MTWLNPGMLGFLALGSIPIIIYLINRQRYQRVPWAAMEFLLRAMKKHRRRLRIENLLLLIIRTAAVILFVLAMARPSLESGALPTFGSTGRSELYLVDRSYSMALSEAGRSTLEIATDSARERVKGLAKGDRVGLAFGGGFPELATPQPEVVTDAGATLVLGQLEEAEIVYEPLEVAPLLSVAADWTAGESARDTPWVVHLWSDLQRRDWLTADGGVDPAVREALARLEQAGSRVVVHPVGPTRPRNATVSSVRCVNPLLAIDLPTTFQVAVENHGEETLAALEVELWIDDEVQGSRRITVEAEGSAIVSFPHVFREVGLARVRAVLRTDDLEVDNERVGVFEVRDAIEVLVADGSFDPDEGTSEADWIEAALGGDPVTETGVRLSPYRLTVVPADRLPAEPLERYRVLVLVDVPELSVAEVERVEGFLAQGGGVLCFAGERFRAGDYSLRSWRGGEGWFPYEPQGAVVDRERRTFYHWQVLVPTHPALEYLAATPEAGIGDVAVHGFIRPGSTEGSTVLLSLDDLAATPALVERPFGSGTTLALTTGAGRRWSNFPISPAYVVFLHEALPYLATRDETSRNLAIGEPFRRILPAEQFAPRVLLVRPTGDGVPVALEEREDRKSFDLRIDGQSRPGAYELRFGGLGEEEGRSEWFAVNPDPREGDLTLLAADVLVESYPALTLAEERREVVSDADATTGDLWMPLFWTVLALLVAESALARFFGDRRARRAA